MLVNKVPKANSVKIVLKPKPGTNQEQFVRKARELKDLANRNKLFKSKSVRNPNQTTEYK